MSAFLSVRGLLRLSATAAVAFGLVAILGGTASAQCLTPQGDINDDGVTNVLDLQCLIFASLCELDESCSEFPACVVAPAQATDANCDSSTDVSDVLLLVNYAVGLDIDEAIDADGDQCPDACEVPAAYGALPAIATGTSSSASFTLRATAKGFQATGSSTGATSGLTLKPKTVKAAD